MDQTVKTFKDKWENNPNLIFSETLDEKSDVFNWIINRNGFGNSTEFRKFISAKNRILDAGCGNGRVTALLQKYSEPTAQIVAIDIAAAEVATENLKQFQNISVFEKDLLQDLSDLGKFDFIYCQEVLHHTKDPFGSFKNLASLLDKEGEIAIYVYKKKAPIREFVDDYVRNNISVLNYDEAMKTCRQITELGKRLSETNIKINVPDVDILQIKGGEYDLQRFIYHFFMKCFWNKEYSAESNAAINFDWYHPQLCSRHTLDEVRKWFMDTNLEIVKENVDFYGITMSGIKH